MALSATKAHILLNYKIKAVLIRKKDYYRRKGIDIIQGNAGKEPSQNNFSSLGSLPR